MSRNYASLTTSWEQDVPYEKKDGNEAAYLASRCWAGRDDEKKETWTEGDETD
jgi:hypothetical protein